MNRKLCITGDLYDLILQAHIYELQVRSLQGRLREATQEIQSWRSKVGEAENRVRAMEDRNRGLEGELSEVKTQLIWASEEHEQVCVENWLNVI